MVMKDDMDGGNGHIRKIKRQDLHLETEIGCGGFASVYKAVWNQTKVAAKRLINSNLGKLEMEMLSGLNHRNIVKMFGVVDENHDFFIVMELCGGTLRAFLDQKNGEKLPTDQFFHFAMQAGRPIKYLRAKGLVHKDIKSPNYLISKGLILKLCDFGSAKNITITMSNASSTASFAWMPPELIKDQILSTTYDIYGYGVVIWELWTTKVPFEGCLPVYIVWRVCTSNETPPIPTDCPEPIADLMRSCWKSRTDRPTIDCILIKLSSCEQEVTREVQKQFIDGPWVLEVNFGLQGQGKLSDPRGVAVGSNLISVTDSEEGNVKWFSTDGDYQTSSNASHQLQPIMDGFKSISITESNLDPWLQSRMESKPWNVIINPDGKYALTDCTDHVSVYNHQGNCESQWAVFSSDHKSSEEEPSQLQGLAVDAHMQTLVGESVRRYISIHKPNTEHVSTIDIGIRPHFLAVTSCDTIVICDRTDNIVQIIHKSGDVLHTLKPDAADVPYWAPKGVCCHDNMVFVSNYATHAICCFSVSGEYLGSIPTAKWPMAIAYAKDIQSFVVTHRNEGRVTVYKRDSRH